MTVKYNQNGELTMDGISLKTIAQSFGTPTIVYDELQIREQMRRYHRAFKDSGLKIQYFIRLKGIYLHSNGQTCS